MAFHGRGIASDRWEANKKHHEGHSCEQQRDRCANSAGGGHRGQPLHKPDSEHIQEAQKADLLGRQDQVDCDHAAEKGFSDEQHF